MSQHRAPAIWVRPGPAAAALDAVLDAGPSIRTTPRPAPAPAPGVRTGADAGLVSGEAVELDVRVARVGSRAVALLLDIVIQVAALAILTPLAIMSVTSAFPFADDALIQGIVLVSFVLVIVGYPVIFEVTTGGRTLGKFALGLRVVRDDGGPIRFRHALTRALVGAALEWPGLVLPLVTWVASLGTMLTSPRGKRLGDLAAGTIVIHERSPAAWGWVPGMPPPLASWATTLDLTGLTDDLALAVRHFLARGYALAEPERSRLGQALATEVAAVTTPPAPPGVPGWAYLAAVLAERHRRAAHRLARARAVTARLWPELAADTTGRPSFGWSVPGAPAPAHRTPEHAASAYGAPAPTSPGRETQGDRSSEPAAPGRGSRGPAPPGHGSPDARPASGVARGFPAAAQAGWGQAPRAHPTDEPGRPAAPPPNLATVDWEGHVWPTPPWQTTTGEHRVPDWTGLRPPPVASTLRPPAPTDS